MRTKAGMERMQEKKRKMILIIDDDMNIGDLEQEILEQAGYGCQRAYSGTEALLCLEHTRPDLILLDLMLPGLYGNIFENAYEPFAVQAAGSRRKRVYQVSMGNRIYAERRIGKWIPEILTISQRFP